MIYNRVVTQIDHFPGVNNHLPTVYRYAYYPVCACVYMIFYNISLFNNYYGLQGHKTYYNIMCGLTRKQLRIFFRLLFYRLIRIKYI